MASQQQVQPARRRGLADEVADRIRDGIFAGAYTPGRPLREVELSTVMEVSRGPVREALRLLEREGLVHCTWHRGATVTTLSRRDVVELDSLRGVLEELAVHEVARNATEDDFTTIETTADLMRRAVDPHEMVYLDIVFHDAVFAASHHQRLVDAWHGIRRQVHLFLLTRIARSTEGYLDRIPAEHRELAAALRTRNAAAAIPLFAEHRRRAFDILVEPT